MVRTILLAAAAAFALVAAAPAFGCPNCHDCPNHQAAAGDKAGKTEAGKKAVACACAGEGAECKCGDACHCPHCHAKKEEKKDAKKS